MPSITHEEYRKFMGAKRPMSLKNPNEPIVWVVNNSVVYLEINDHIYYIDDSTNEQVMKKWKKEEGGKNTLI